MSRQEVGAPGPENFGLTNVAECFMDATYSSVKNTLKGMGRSPNGTTVYFWLQRQ